MPGFWIPVWKNFALQERVANMFFCECGATIHKAVGKELPTACPNCKEAIPALDK